eukprot:SAG31_NODE_214_length_20084_cov_2.644684_11_plen_234_part_00
MNKSDCTSSRSAEELPDWGVPEGFVGRLPRQAEFSSLEEYSEAVAAALEVRSFEICSNRPVEVEKVRLSDVCDAEFLQRWGRLGLPVVFTECGSEAGWDLSGCWSPAALARDHGDCPWMVRRGRQYDEMETAETTLGCYLDEAAESANRCSSDADAHDRSASARSDFYGANNFVPPALVPLLRLPPFLPAHVKRLLDTRVWIGPPGCGAFGAANCQNHFAEAHSMCQRRALSP